MLSTFLATYNFAVDRFTMTCAGEYSIPHTAQYPTHKSFTSLKVAIEKEMNATKPKAGGGGLSR
jgi:hypothetical protein